jgi:hypothetical protein
MNMNLPGLRSHPFVRCFPPLRANVRSINCLTLRDGSVAGTEGCVEFGSMRTARELRKKIEKDRKHKFYAQSIP